MQGGREKSIHFENLISKWEILLTARCLILLTAKVVFATLLVYVLSNNGIGSSIWNFGITTHRYHLFDGHSFKQFRETVN